MRLGFFFVVSCFATGCLLNADQGDPVDPDEEPDGPRPGPEEPDAPLIADCSGGGDCIAPPIAVGGTTTFPARTAVTTSGPFEWLGDGRVRATGAGVGTLSGHWFSVPVSSRPIGAIRLGPLFTRAPRFTFVLDGETPFPEDLPGIQRPLALHVSDPHGVVRLYSTEYDEPYGAERLVDTSMHIVDPAPGITLTSWDVISVPPVAGRHHVMLEADSFGAFSLSVLVVDHLDRLDADVWQMPTTGGTSGIVCFHAYTDFVEVAIDMSLSIAGAGEGAGSAGRNCVTAHATGPGTMTITATAGELTATADLVIP